MSSITRQNYQSFKSSFQDLWTRLQQSMDSCKHVPQQNEAIQQIIWQEFEEDVKLVLRIIVNLSEVLEEQWSNVDKLEEFIRNLEADNTQFFEENSKNIIKLQESQLQKAELNRAICELKNSLDILTKKDKQAKARQQRIDLQNKYYSQLKQLELGISGLQKKVQSISFQKTEVQQQLCLKNTQIQLAMLVIQDLKEKVNRQKQQDLLNTAYHENEDTKSCNSAQSSQKRLQKRHSSLLEDLVQSQLIYEPRICSQMFKSTQTIEEGAEYNHYQYSNIHIKSRVRANQRKSKAVSTRIIPQFMDSQTQTDCQQPFYERCFGIMKNKIVSQRIKK